jgi:RNA polymerase sigma-70 factor (ECF subfamily)
MEPESYASILAQAQQGDINAFQRLFADFQPKLKSYLYRLLTDRNDAEDLLHDSFVRAFDKLPAFRGESSLKTWVFAIATRLAQDHLKKRRRWGAEAQALAKELVLRDASLREALNATSRSLGEEAYDMREHIDFCFTCMAKTLPLEEQVALILKEVYAFSVQEVAQVLGKSEGVVKHLLLGARRTLSEIFEQRCALINKQGVCNQCSELNGIHNPRQDQQAALMKLELVQAKTSQKYDREALLELRLRLVEGIDPLRARGASLHELLMRCTRKAIGEIKQVQ